MKFEFYKPPLSAIITLLVATMYVVTVVIDTKPVAKWEAIVPAVLLFLLLFWHDLHEQARKQLAREQKKLSIELDELLVRVRTENAAFDAKLETALKFTTALVRGKEESS